MCIPHWWNIIFSGFAGVNVSLVSVGWWWWKFYFTKLPLGSGDTFKHVEFVTYCQKTIFFARVVKLSILLGCTDSLFSRGRLKDFVFIINAYERISGPDISMMYQGGASGWFVRMNSLARSRNPSWSKIWNSNIF